MEMCKQFKVIKFSIIESGTSDVMHAKVVDLETGKKLYVDEFVCDGSVKRGWVSIIWDIKEKIGIVDENLNSLYCALDNALKQK